MTRLGSGYESTFVWPLVGHGKQTERRFQSFTFGLLLLFLCVGSLTGTPQKGRVIDSSTVYQWGEDTTTFY